MDGNYSLSVPDGQSVLVFSFVGMETQEININGRSVVNVEMTPSTIGVDEVVVTALGISREKKSLGYSVSEIDGQSIEKVAQENVLNSLSGKLAGVAINSTGGAGSSDRLERKGLQCFMSCPFFLQICIT